MSFWVNMGFCYVDSAKDVFSIIKRIKAELLSDAKGLIDDNKYYIPSMRYRVEDERAIELVNETWIKSLFSFRVLYWEQYNLVGIVASKDIEWLKYVEFQNSTDTDYAMDVWPEIPFFQGVVQHYNSLSDVELWETAKETRFFDDEAFDEGADTEGLLDYYKCSRVYAEIFDKLHLDDYIYHSGVEGGNFELLNIQCIDEQAEVYRLTKLCQVYK